jgi:hypothetical protein
MRRYVQGKLTLVQEQRFQLVDDAGVSHLFILASDVSLKPADLRAILESQQPVRVEYEDAASLIARIATAIKSADHPQETA